MIQDLDEELPPLPPELERGARALRRVVPPDALRTRLTRALAKGSRPRSRAHRPPPTAWWAFVPAAAFALLVLHGGDITDETEEMERQVEHELSTDDSGRAQVSLDLWTGPHGGARTTVNVTAPDTVGLQLGTDAPIEPGVCRGNTCDHRYAQDGDGETPLTVHLPGPGRYHVDVEHASRTHRVRERFILVAH